LELKQKVPPRFSRNPLQNKDIVTHFATGSGISTLPSRAHRRLSGTDERRDAASISIPIPIPIAIPIWRRRLWAPLPD